MSSRMFQGVLLQLSEAAQTTIGVIDAEGNVISCSDTTLIGEKWPDAATAVVLLPEIQDARIEKIGGKGKEFWVFGTNYANDAMPRRPDDANERGAWRVEISPVTAAAENYFLNVMQVADNTCLQMNEVKRIDADKIVGVQIADRVVTFSKDSQPLPGKFDFAVSGSQTMKFVITDLIPGTWQIKKDGKVYIPALEVRTDDGILSFEGTAGRYEFLR